MVEQVEQGGGRQGRRGGGRGRGGRGRGRGGRGRGRGGRGRGRGRQGQGQQMQGRAGRGMSAGRGRMAKGRGGRGGGPAQTPTFLNYLNAYNVMSVMSYLKIEEREALGKAYIRFQMKKPPNKAQPGAKNNKNGQAQGQQPASAEGPADQSKESKTEEVKQKEPQPEEATVETEEKETSSQEEKKEENETSDKKPGDAAVSSEANPSVSDPHTLLARLNTRRLYRRIRHLQKENKDLDPKDVYRFNLTTEQIAIHEWKALLGQFQTQSRKVKEEEKEDEESKEGEGEENKKAKERKFPSPIPSSCEMLLFSPCPRAVAVLASYPRSGNSLLRTLYEKTTLRVTGSDMRGGLTKHDLVGEMAVQTNCVQFVKTHFPERRGNPPFRVNRAVLLVRNPYDAMESYFNLMMTNTHTASLSDEQREQNVQVFADMAKKEIQVWKDFHEYWLQQKIPLLVIRYEDLIRYTDKVIAKVIRFVLEINDMKFFEERIDRCIREEQIERLGSYRPRSGGIGKSLSKYSPELLQEINTGILSTMEKFGYDEMLVPNPKEWNLEPLDQCGVEIAGTPNAAMAINGKGIVRGPKRQTDWRAVRRQMNGEKKEAKCTCSRCVTGGGR